MSQMCPNRPVSTQATEEWFPRMRTEPPPLFGDLKSPLIKKSSMRPWRGMTSKIKERALEPKFWDRDEEEPMERDDISLM